MKVELTPEQIERQKALAGVDAELAAVVQEIKALTGSDTDGTDARSAEQGREAELREQHSALCRKRQLVYDWVKTE